MTLSSATNEWEYAGNGVTTVFAYTTKIHAASHLVVTVVDSTGTSSVKVLNTDYTVSGVNSSSGGSVTFTTAPAALSTVVIERTVPLTQSTDIKNQGDFYPESHENTFDRLTMAIQQVNRLATRALRTPAGLDDYDAGGVKIVDLEDGEDASDAATKGQLDDAVTSMQAGLGGTVANYVTGTGNGSSVYLSFPGIEVSTAAAYVVVVGGLVQRPETDYTIDVANERIVFSTAPGNGVATLAICYGYKRQISDDDALNITYAPAGSGATQRSVRSRLRDFVTATDFGATGDGTTDDTAALQAAINHCLLYGRTLYIPSGTYKFTQLTAATVGSGLGPLRIIGDGTPFVQYGAKGTILRQIDGTTGTAITIAGDWAASDLMLGVSIVGVGLYCSNALTGWGIDMFNVVGFHSNFDQIAIYCPNATSAGAWRQRSCWTITMSNIRCDGPSSGTTAKGLVIYGDQGTGTTNQVALNNVNCVGFPKCNTQIGKWDESGGGTTQGITWTSGQCGTAAGYGVVIGRAFDVTISGVHTENHQKSGWLITESANGADPGRIKLIQCDSYGDGAGGTGTADADTYTIQIKRGNFIQVDGFGMQEALCGVWIDDTTQCTNIELDRMVYGGASNNTDAETIIRVENSSPDIEKRVTIGNYTVGYTWGNNGANIIENGDCLSYRKVTDADGQRATTTGTESILPWTSDVSLAPPTVGINKTANNGSGLVRITTASAHGLSTSDVVRVWGVVGTVEANGVWTITVINATNFDLQGSAYTNAYSASSFDRCGNIRELTDFVAETNYEIAQGQLLTVNCGAGNLKFVDVDNGGNFYMKDARDYIPDNRDTVVFHRRGTAWYEVSRSMARSYMQDNGGTDETFTVREYGTSTSITVNNLTETVVLAHSGATNLDTLGDASGREPREGHVVRLRATNGNTTVKDASGGGSAKFRLAGGSDWAPMGNRDTLTVMKVGTEWHELSRSNN